MELWTVLISSLVGAGVAIFIRVMDGRQKRAELELNKVQKAADHEQAEEQNRRLAELERRKADAEVLEQQTKRYDNIIVRLEEENTRLEIDRDQARQETAQARADATAGTEKVLNTFAEALNKISVGNNALADAIRELMAETAESRRLMRDVVTGIVSKQGSIDTNIGVIMTKIDAVMEEIRAGNGKHGAQLDAIHELIQQLVEMAAQNTP